MKIRVRYFALYRDLAGKPDETVSMEEGSTLGSLLEQVKGSHPLFNKQQGQFLLAVNEEYAEPEKVLREGDEVAIFPNVSGG